MTLSSVRMAMVGCGAIAEFGHLPAVGLSEVILGAVVDPNETRANEMAKRYGAERAFGSALEAAPYVDFACVAIPHHLHRQECVRLLEAGLHLLVEKPLATTVEDCDQVIAAARANGRILGVAMPRRFSPAANFLKGAITVDLLDTLFSYNLESGSDAIWPARSSYMLDAKQSGGGVLMGNGCHDVDFVTWLFGPIKSITCQLDSLMLLDTNAVLAVQHESGLIGHIELSRTRNLRNSLQVFGRNGMLECELIGDGFTMNLAAGDDVMALADGKVRAKDPFSFTSLMAEQLNNFAQAVRSGIPPAVSGNDGRETVSIINACYKNASLLRHPWQREIEWR